MAALGTGARDRGVEGAMVELGFGGGDFTAQGTVLAPAWWWVVRGGGLVMLGWRVAGAGGCGWLWVAVGGGGGG